MNSVPTPEEENNGNIYRKEYNLPEGQSRVLFKEKN